MGPHQNWVAGSASHFHFHSSHGFGPSATGDCTILGAKLESSPREELSEPKQTTPGGGGSRMTPTGLVPGKETTRPLPGFFGGFEGDGYRTSIFLFSGGFNQYSLRGFHEKFSRPSPKNTKKLQKNAPFCENSKSRLSFPGTHSREKDWLISL